MKSSAELIREYGSEVDRLVAARSQLTAQAVFDEAFPAWRPKRSAEYRNGVLRQLRYRMKETDCAKCPYADGSVQADAYWAGVSEAWNILEKHRCDRRK